MAAGDDPITVAPDVYSVLFENERVRVLDVHMKPGAKSALHAHPAAVFYVLTPGTTRFTTGDGHSMEMDLQPGPVWLDAQTHAAENTGSTEVRAVAVELK